MKARKISKLVGLMGAACLSLGVFVSPAATLPAQAAVPSVSQPQSDYIEWIYKIDGGRKYKRLYNYSIGEWVGEWIDLGPVGKGESSEDGGKH